MWLAGAPSRPLVAPASLRPGLGGPAAAAAARAPACSIGRPSRRHRSRRRTTIAASNNSGGPDDGSDEEDSSSSFDIDALASALSRAAEERRRRADEGGNIEGDDSVADPPPLDTTTPTPTPTPSSSPSSSSFSFSSASPFGAGAKRREEEVLEELGGDGGFEPDEIELLQELGRVSWITSESSSSSRNSSLSAPKTAAAVYAARYNPPTPLMSPTIVLVKEYFPHASSLACNELQVGARLSSGGSLPARKWHAARSDGPPPPAPPAALPLLGWFEAASAPASASQEEEEREFGAGTLPSPFVSDPDARSLWLVFKWVGGQPLSFYAQQQQQQQQQSKRGSKRPTGLAALLPSALLFKSPERALEEALEKRSRMIRRIASGATTALATVHAAGVAHGSLGGGCVLLSTFDDAASAKLTVCLDNFGFATMRRSSGGDTNVSASAEFDDDDDPVLVAQAADARQLGRLLLETALLALGRVATTTPASDGRGGESDPSSSSSASSSSASSSSDANHHEVNAYASLESAGPAVREAGARVLEAVAAAVSSTSTSSSSSTRKSRDGENEEEEEELESELDPAILLAAEAARRVCSCAPSGEWDAAVELLDDDGGAGWELVAALAAGVLPARLLASRFFLQAKSR